MAFPTGAGWVRRSVSAIATGTTDLTIDCPAGVVDGDILLMDLAHQGAGFAVVPAGWTVVGQGVQGATRGEMYWKRAAGEPANYFVSGLATVAQGVIAAYPGGLAAGNVLNVVSVGQTAAGVKFAAGSITPTQPRVLIHAMVACGASLGTISPGFALDSAAATIVVIDPAINPPTSIVQGGTAGLDLAVWDAIKVVPGATGDLYDIVAFTTEHVGILAAFIAETSAVQATTRYYLSAKPTPKRIYGPPQGDWSQTWNSPRGFDTMDYNWQLSLLKSDGGQVRFGTQEQTVCNEEGADVLYHRWLSPPLTAQAIAGTFDTMIAFSTLRHDSGSPNTIGQMKVHVYLADGQSLTPKATLLNQYTDAVTWGNTFIYRQLAAPQALTPTNAADGDCIVVELGVHFTTDAPFTSPIARPPTQYGRILGGRGCTEQISGGSQRSTVGLLDATAGSASTSLAPYVEFSQVFTHKDVVPVPTTNISCATATAIAALPYDSGDIDTTGTPAPSREQWYTWTAPFTGRVFFHTWGGNYKIVTTIYTGACGALVAKGAPTVEVIDGQVFFSTSVSRIDAVQGTTYTIRLQQETTPENAPAAGGVFHFTFVQRQAAANNDLFYPNAIGYLVRYTSAGVLADISTLFRGFALSGIAIDYTRRPVYDENWDLNTGDRVYYALFGTDIVEISDVNAIDVELNFMYERGAGFGVLKHLAALSMNAAGLLAWGWFGNGFTKVAGPTVSYLQEVSTALTADITLIDGTQVNSSPDVPPNPIYTHHPTTLEAGGTNYVEFDQAGENIYYTSGGWYFPVGGQNVYKHNVATATTTLFATVPIGPGPNPGLKGLFPLPLTPTTPAGGLLVCNGAQVVRLDAAGAVVTTYTPVAAGLVTSLADVELTSDGRFFWVLDEQSSTLFKFDMHTGLQVLALPTWLGPGDSTSIAVYRLEPFPAGGVRVTQLPVEAAYDYHLLQPFVSGAGRNWITPPLG